MEIKSILIKDTTREERIRTVQSPHISQSAIQGNVSLIYCRLSSSVDVLISGGLIHSPTLPVQSYFGTPR